MSFTSMFESFAEKAMISVCTKVIALADKLEDKPVVGPAITWVKKEDEEIREEIDFELHQLESDYVELEADKWVRWHAHETEESRTAVLLDHKIYEIEMKKRLARITYTRILLRKVKALVARTWKSIVARVCTFFSSPFVKKSVAHVGIAGVCLMAYAK